VAETAIEWATHVWNPVTGCDRVSPGCAHCYALTYAARLKGMGQPKYQRDGGKASGSGFGVTLHEAALEEPAHWRKPRRVFVNSMSDLFHDEVPTLFIGRVLNVIAAAPAHDFLVLTKRADRMRDVMTAYYTVVRDDLEKPYPNLWLGVSIENRRFVHRADVLRETPAAVRFISAEPLLGPLIGPDTVNVAEGSEIRTVRGWVSKDGFSYRPSLDLAGIDWLIVGGESGHGFRPVNEDWIGNLRDAALPAGTAFFFKQWGGLTPKSGGRELDGRTWDEIPARATAGQGMPAHG
jgi:protein gp37